MEGNKNDNNKPSMELIEPSFLVGLAKVLDFGKEKYGRNNWRAGFNYSRLISASYRHLAAVHAGEDVDSESNLPHIYHLAVNVMMLAWMMENRKDKDDRYKKAVLSSDFKYYPPPGSYAPYQSAMSSLGLENGIWTTLFGGNSK